MTTSARNPKTIAMIATLLIALLLIIVLIITRLNLILPEDREWPPVKHSDIEMLDLEEETFVEVVSQAGDEVMEQFDSNEAGASDVTDNSETSLSHDLVTAAPAKGNTAPATSSNQPSPVEQKKTDKPAGASKVDDSAAKAEAARQQQAKKNIENKLANRFSGAGKGDGKASDTDGKTASSGSGGGTGIGMTASADVRPRSNKLGTIVVSVTVLPDGSVRPGSASLNLSRCSGDAGTDTALRNSCLASAYKCRFSRRVGETNNVPGTITFKWE